MYRLATVTLFSLAIGHYAWEVYSPRNTPEYMVGGGVSALRAPSQGSHLYLRHTFHASRRPRSGWLQALGRSRITVYINGQPVADERNDGFPVAVLLDIAPFLQRGKNVIALATEQSGVGQPGLGLASVDPPPELAVEGGCECAGAERRLGAGSSWKCRDAFERTAYWWFETEFEDRHWMEPDVRSAHLRATVDVPPRAVKESTGGAWIVPARSMATDRAVFFRPFDVSARPHTAWLRLTTASAYRLAINGVVVDVQDRPLGTETPATAIQRVYDLTPFIRRGRNLVAIAAISNTRPPRVLVDAEVLTDAGNVLRFDSDSRWRALAGIPVRWHMASAGGGGGDGRPCVTETGDVGIPPWAPKREVSRTSLAGTSHLIRLGFQFGLIAFIGVATAAGCSVGSRYIRVHGGAPWTPTERPCRAEACVYAALWLPSILLAALMLAAYDPRVPRQTVYREWWVVAAVISVPLQWMLLAWMRPLNAVFQRSVEKCVRRSSSEWVVLAGLLITLAGFWLRYREIDVKPLQHDEASAYRSTQGFFERGFPSREIHPDMPPKLVETSELVYFCTALASLVCEQDLYVVRVPAVFWGSTTIYLIFVVGWRMFSPAVGLTAASIYAVSPICVQMACFGRYFSQLQFFTLLTVYFFWSAIRATGPIHRSALWCTAVSFLGMYFTWQGSALVAPGLVLAGLVHGRGRMATMIADRKVWTAMGVVLAIIVVHMSCRSLHLSQFLAYGVGISGLSLTQMWRFPDFDLTYCLWQSSWNRDALVPLLGVAGAALVAASAPEDPFRRPARLILIVLMTTCTIQSLVLPVYTWRYSFHLTPLVILLASVSMIAAARFTVVRVGRAAPLTWRAYARAVATCAVLVAVAAGSGATLQLTELSSMHIHSYDLPDLSFADMSDAMRFLRARLQPGDIIIASNPHVVDHYMNARRCDFWLQSRFYTQALLDDYRAKALHRIAGTVMISSRQELEELFARENRIWYVMIPSRHGSQNTADVTSFVRQHMQVAYQDYRALVLFRGGQNYPASRRQRDEWMLLDAAADPLPD